MVTQDDAFKGGQEVGNARGVGVNTRPTGNITQAPLIDTSSLNPLLKVVSDFAEDRQKLRLGADLEKAREALIQIDNPVTQQVRKSEYTFKLAKIYGAVNFPLIRSALESITAPQVRVNLQKRTLQVNTSGGEFKEIPLNLVNNPNIQAANTIKAIGSRFKSNLPKFTEVLNNITLKSNEYRAKNGLPTMEKGELGQTMVEAMVMWANPVSAFEKAQATITAMRANPEWRNLAGTQNFTNQVFDQALGTMWLGMGKFLDGKLMAMLGNRRAYGITDSQMSAAVFQYANEMTQVIQRFGAMSGMGSEKINKAVQELTSRAKAIQEAYINQYQGRLRQVSLIRGELALEFQSKNMAAIRRLDADMKRQFGFGFYDIKHKSSMFKDIYSLVTQYKALNTALGGTMAPRADAYIMESIIRSFDLYGPYRKGLEDSMNRGVKDNAEGLRLFRDMRGFLTDRASLVGANLLTAKKMKDFLEREGDSLVKNGYMNEKMVKELRSKLDIIFKTIAAGDKAAANRARESGGTAETTEEKIKRLKGIFDGLTGRVPDITGGETGGF